MRKMNDDFIVKNGKKLKIGYTTGTCASVAAKAAVSMLVLGDIVEKIEYSIKTNHKFSIDIHDIQINKDEVVCSVIKISGDDPDVTNGIKIFAKARKIEEGIIIDGGIGIGRVTKSGLKVKVGEAAINPEPRAYIIEAIRSVLDKSDYNGGVEVIIFSPEGEERAKKTYNERLGIIGGISILGTTGVVEPMSEKAIIETIKLEINKYKGEKKLLLTVGNYGKSFVENKLGLKDGVKCSNFIGEALDYAGYIGFEDILLVGHAGKLIKLAGGIMNTHSRIADCRIEILAAHAAMAGLKQDTILKIMNSITVEEAFSIISCFKQKDIILNSISQNIRKHLELRLAGKSKINFILFLNDNKLLLEDILK